MSLHILTFDTKTLIYGYADSPDCVETIRETFAPLGKICGNLAAKAEDYEFEAAFEMLLAIRSLLEGRLRAVSE